MRYAYFDTDNTLVLWDKPKSKLRRVKIRDPKSGDIHKLWVHEKHVKILKIIASHGDTVVVWSAAGAEWASAVVAALDLLPYVSYCLQKPDTVYDDEPTTQWITPTPRYQQP